VDQYYNNSQNEFLWTLLANPANEPGMYAYNLQRLVNDFPQSGILQALLAHASEEKNLKQASAYFAPKALYKLINAPSTFIGVAEEKIIIQNSLRNLGSYYPETALETATPFVPAETFSDPFEHHSEGEVTEPEQTIDQPVEIVTADMHQEPFLDIPPVIDHHLTDKVHEPGDVYLPEEHAIPATEEASTAKAEEEVEKKQHEPIIENSFNDLMSVDHHQAGIEKDGADTQPAASPAHTEAPVADTGTHQIEDEIFEEIGDNTSAEPVQANHPAEQLEAKDEMYRPSFKPNWTSAPEDELNFDDDVALAAEEEKLIAASIASADYFTLDRKLEDQPVESGHGAVENENAPDVIEPEEAAAEPTHKAESDQQDVSKYHDEKMPYSFMWWLDKTRKEHSGIYQPYIKTETPVAETPEKKPEDELQQQYYENIFHITSVEELDKITAPKAAPVKPDLKRKEQIIIERFIQEEPQIKPQSSDKLDNENKAKKSSEDRDELVTETLAAIYTEQMLYHKAISSYKKLMLKFPEKSRYFAEKIEQLEKKTN
jgi:hypothetical protein